jgi:FkbM family methyltransferase
MSTRFFLQSAIQKSFRAVGLEINRRRITPEISKAVFPFVRKVETQGIAIEYWVADETAQAWYPPAAFSDLGEMGAEMGETRRLIKPGDRILEIGAHHGIYMLLLAKLVGPEGFVLSVEAHPFNAMIADAQIALNGLGNCRLIHAAASDRPGSLQMSSDSNASVMESVGIRVPALTGDELDARFGPFTVLKVDVEGYEGVVLDGCKEILSRDPRLLLEVHSPLLSSYGTSMNELLEKIPARYDGTMILRSNRKGQSAIRPFRPETLPVEEIVNLFLWPSAGSLTISL